MRRREISTPRQAGPKRTRAQARHIWRSMPSGRDLACSPRDGAAAVAQSAILNHVRSSSAQASVLLSEPAYFAQEPTFKFTVDATALH